MTLPETRQLGIEFERRVQTMIPDTEFQAKLDTETIYSFLNQYQDKFVHDIYKQIDRIETPSKISSYAETILQGLLRDFTTDVTATDSHYSVNLPPKFGLYVSSATVASKAYSMKNTTASTGESGVLPNVLMSKQAAHSFETRPNDGMRIIRQPIAFLSSSNTIDVIVDKYTQPTAFKMTYYKVPDYMDIINNKACELPMEAFEDLVSGAIDLYVQYAAGAEARKNQLINEAKKRKPEE